MQHGVYLIVTLCLSWWLILHVFKIIREPCPTGTNCSHWQWCDSKRFLITCIQLRLLDQVALFVQLSMCWYTLRSVLHQLALKLVTCLWVVENSINVRIASGFINVFWYITLFTNRSFILLVGCQYTDDVLLACFYIIRVISWHLEMPLLLLSPLLWTIVQMW